MTHQRPKPSLGPLCSGQTHRAERSLEISLVSLFPAGLLNQAENKADAEQELLQGAGHFLAVSFSHVASRPGTLPGSCRGALLGSEANAPSPEISFSFSTDDYALYDLSLQND